MYTWHADCRFSGLYLCYLVHFQATSSVLITHVSALKCLIPDPCAERALAPVQIAPAETPGRQGFRMNDIYLRVFVASWLSE
jgi:hypothetical protein